MAGTVQGLWHIQVMTFRDMIHRTLSESVINLIPIIEPSGEEYELP